MNWLELLAFAGVMVVMVVLVAVVVIKQPKLAYPVSIVLNIGAVAGFLVYKFGFAVLTAPPGMVAIIFGLVLGVFFAFTLTKRRAALVSSEYKPKQL